MNPWKAIETAPKDGTVILALLPGSDVPHAIKWWMNSWMVSWDGYVLSKNDWPTHWMPCPATGNPIEPELSPGEVIVGAVIRANALDTLRENPDGSHVFVWAANCYEQIEASLAEEGWMLVRKP